MVVDGKGNTYLAWVDSAKGGIVVSTQFDGTRFNKQYIVQTAVLPAFQPQMAAYDNSGTGPNVEIVWASVDPASTPTAPLYDVFASRSDTAGATFTAPILVSASSGPVPLADSPRVAFDIFGQDEHSLGAARCLDHASSRWFSVWRARQFASRNGSCYSTPRHWRPSNRGFCRQSDLRGWTDESAKAQTAPGNYCTNEITDTNGTVTNTYGGNFWMNETVPSQTGSGVPSNLNTRNLSTTDWERKVVKIRSFLSDFFGCSYDNLSLFADKPGHIHLLWSDDTPIEDVLTSEFHGIYTGMDRRSPARLSSHSPSIWRVMQRPPRRLPLIRTEVSTLFGQEDRTRARVPKVFSSVVPTTAEAPSLRESTSRLPDPQPYPRLSRRWLSIPAAT